jgi:hypothetical protein
LKGRKRKNEPISSDAFMNVTWCKEMKANIYATVLLDNKADISIMHPLLLRDIKPAEKKIRVSGVGGVQLIFDIVGVLGGFFKCMLVMR